MYCRSTPKIRYLMHAVARQSEVDYCADLPEMKMRVTVRHSAKGAICTACSGSGKGLNFFWLRWTSSDKNAFSFRGQ